MSRLLKESLTEKLRQELPGAKSHLEAAPFRKTVFNEVELSGARESAVLVLFYQKNKETYIALIQRPKYNGAHSGQIALPGGKVEVSDRDLIHTALREANEEVGVVTEDVEVIGQLSEIYIPVSNFKVAPIVGFIDYYPNFILDEREVEELIELKLSELTNVKELSETKINFSNSSVLKTPCFNFNTKIVWGATAIILNELRWVLKGKS
jgi:8-oxo-dGTP pyrophosphatase MutT (NUDIX family)